LQISFQIHTAVNNYSAIQSDPLIFLVNVTRLVLRVRLKIFVRNIIFLISDNPDSKKLITEIIIPVSSSPEIILIGYEEEEKNPQKSIFLFCLISVLQNQSK